MKKNRMFHIIPLGLIVLFLMVSVCDASIQLSRDTVSAETVQNVVLGISEAGRYSIQLESRSGASFRMIDPVRGPGKVYGVSGAVDGRKDAFLDSGDYLLTVTGAGHPDETVTISVMPFTEVSHHQESLPGTEPYETSLNDLEAMDFWFSVSEPQMIYIDSAGRALNDMRIWLHGTWLSEFEPLVSVVDAVAERPLHRRRLMVHCPPGIHRVTLYGGEPLDWAYGGVEMPLYIRSGISSVSAAGSISRNISIFGEDLFLVASGADFFRLDSMIQGTGLTVTEYNDLSESILDQSFARRIFDTRTPFVEATGYYADGSKLVKITGRYETHYDLKWFSVNYQNPRTVYYDGTYDLTFFHGGHPADLPDLNVVVIEENRRSPFQEDVLASSTLEVAPNQPVLKRFNVNQPVSLFVRFVEAGNYRIDARGAPGRYVLESFFVRQPRDYVRPAPKSFPSVETVGAFIYKLTIEPDSPGSFELAITPENTEPDWSDIGFAPDTTGDVVRFRGLRFTNQKQYQLFVNDLNVRTGFYQGSPTFGDEPFQASLQPQGTGEPGRRQMTGAPISAFEPGQHITMEKQPGLTARTKIDIARDAVYQIGVVSRFPVRARLRSALRTDLNGFHVADSSNRTTIRQFLKAGEYYIDVMEESGISGTVTVSCQLLGEIYTGLVEPGYFCRAETGEQYYAAADILITEFAEYTITSQTPGVSSMLRLENSDGWPLAVETESIRTMKLDPDTYRLVLLSPPFVQYGRVYVEFDDEPTLFSGHGPELIDLTRPVQGFWLEGDFETTGDIRIFELEAETELTIMHTAGMSSRIVNVVSGDPVAVIPDDTPWTGLIQAGEWALITVSTLPDNLKPYTINITADPLVSGTSADITVPGKTGLRIGGLEPQFATVFINGGIDTRAVLTDDQGRVIASSDDIKGDWNPYIALWLKPGDYTVFVTPVTDQIENVTVTLHLPQFRFEEWPDDNTLVIEPYTDAVRLDTASAPDMITAVHVTSNGLTGTASIPHSFDAVTGQTAMPDRDHVCFSIGDSDSGCIIWSVDRRYDPVTATRSTLQLNRESLRGDTHSFRWSTREISGNTTISTAAVSLDSPGSFRLDIRDNHDDVFISTDNSAFKRLQPGAFTANKTIILARAHSGNQRLTDVTLQRQVLGRNTNNVEWITSMNEETWVDAEMNASDNAVLLITSESPAIHVGQDGNWIKRYDTESGSFTRGIWRHVTDQGTIRRFGFRPEPDDAIPETASGDGIRLSVQMLLFDADTARRHTESAGIFRLPAQSMVFVTSAENIAGYAEDGVVVHDDPDQNRILFYNMNTVESAIAWRPRDTMTVLPDRIRAAHGLSEKTFLAPGFTCEYMITLDTPEHIGIYVQSDSGYLYAQLVDRYDIELASGLLINTALEAGEYRLKITNPSDRPASSVQPYFVLETPNNLTRFGVED
jgi:hypothetical protein